MENKIEKILETLNGEKLTDCFTILQKVTLKLNDVEYEERQKLIFKI
jgi:hypothetical protein